MLYVVISEGPETVAVSLPCSCSEILHEDKGFPERQLAALVASKVYYHLGSFEDSLTYALGAGPLFDVNDKSQYVETIIGECTRSRFRGTLAEWEVANHVQSGRLMSFFFVCSPITQGCMNSIINLSCLMFGFFASKSRCFLRG